MKKILQFLLSITLLTLLTSSTSFAASKTVILKPIKAEIGLSQIYQYNNSAPSSYVSAGGTDLDNALIEDGQFALLDPSLSGPTEAGAPNSILMLDYEKNTICPQAQIQKVTINAIWKSDSEVSQPTSAAILSFVDYYEGSPSYKVQLNQDATQATLLNKTFGGLVNPSSLYIPGATFSGLVGTSLTKDSSDVQILPNLNDLNSPSARIGISMGQTEPNLVTGMLDYAFLEVIYDDVNCLPSQIDISTLKPPQTGSALTIGIISAGIMALIFTSILGAKKTKLKHRVSERE